VPVGFRLGLGKTDPGDLIRRAQAGDRSAREEILERFAPFAVRVASRHVGRYLDRGRDDEASVALLALNEAVDAFRAERGRAFAGFVEQVIRRRLVDHHRRSARLELPVSELEEQDEEGHTYLAAFDRQALVQHDLEREADARREEIRRYNEVLSRFGLSLAELVRLSPRHEDARRNAMTVARLVAEDDALRRHLWSRKELPLKDLTDRVAVSRKTLERQRKYIIALALVWCGDFPHLREYVRKGGGAA
jgi:RNA polymerase sigma factor